MVENILQRNNQSEIRNDDVIDGLQQRALMLLDLLADA